MEQRLIDANALEEHKFVGNKFVRNDYQQGWNDAIDAIIDIAPTIEPKKGKWEVIGLVTDYAYCKCSECGKTTRLYRDSKNEFCCIADIRNKVIACMYCSARMER